MHRVSATWIDWILGVLAVALLAAFMGVAGQAPGPRTLGGLDTRQMELQARLFEAQASLPDEVKAQIGLAVEVAGSDDVPGDTLSQGKRVLDEIELWRTEHLPTSDDARLVSSALALVLDLPEEACDIMRTVDTSNAAPETGSEAVQALKGLCHGRPTEHMSVLEGTLRTLGSSRWLTLRLRALNSRHASETQAADLTLEEAQALNEGYVSGMLIAVLSAVLFIGLGFLILLAWPFASQRVLRRGWRGLAGTCSPFETGRTFRVLTLWFLIYAAAQLIIGFLGSWIGLGAGGVPLTIATVTLIHGGAVIGLIQTFGRKPLDTRPLGECLRVRVADASGGRRGIFWWGIGGFSVTTACAVIAVLLNGLILGDNVQEQSSVNAFTQATSGADLALLVVSACLLAPVFEEFLFRGFVYRNIRDKLGPWLALVLSSAFFAAAHLDPTNFLPLFAIGGCCAYAYERSGSLWVPMLIHAAWNLSTVMRILAFAGE